MPVAPSVSDAPTVATPIVPDDAHTEPLIVPPSVSEDASDGNASPAPRRRRRLWMVVGVVMVLMLGAGGVAAWQLSRRPDLAAFDDGLRTALRLATEVQTRTDELSDPADLASFASEVRSVRAQLDGVTEIASDLESDVHVRALGRVVDDQAAYLSEVERLAELPSAQANPSEYRRASELARALNEELERAAALRDPDVTFDLLTVSPTSLARTLEELAAYREEVLADRARIKRENRRRAERLETFEAEAAAMDGIIARYSDARADLALWIEGVNRNGATFTEAYDVLAQHRDLRSQLRDELAAQSVSQPFAADKAELLAVMDTAINAMADAERGIAEYEYSWKYLYYDETPGWRAFEDATDAISDDYSAALADYDRHKAETFERFSRRRPLPSLPD